MKNRMLVMAMIWVFTGLSFALAADCNKRNPNYYHKSMIPLVNMTDSLIDKARGYDDRITVSAFLDMVLQFQGICMNAEDIAKTDQKAQRKAAEIKAFKDLSFSLNNRLYADCKEGRSRPSNSTYYGIFVNALTQFRSLISSVA